MPDIAMPTSSLPSTMQRHSDLAVRDSPAFTRHPASNNPFYSLRRRAEASSVAAAASFEPALELDLGDGASHSGSGGNTLERHPQGQSLYI